MSQSSEILEILLDEKAHRVDEIIEKVYKMEKPSVARVGARIFELKEKHGFEIKSWPDPKNRKLWYYQLSPAPRVDSRQDTLTPSQGPVEPPSPGRGMLNDELFPRLDERML